MSRQNYEILCNPAIFESSDDEKITTFALVRRPRRPAGERGVREIEDLFSVMMK